MKTIEYKNIVDKSEWGRGYWENEPDKVQWLDEASGLPCLIVRGPLGAWCGYVGVPEGHPKHGQEYDDVGADVHGGLTFARGCADHSRDAWEKWRSRWPSWAEEAKQFPVGDSARRIKEWAGCQDSYDAWNERMVSRAVCHLPEPGEPDRVWWFGFDCAHLGDIIPGMDNRYGSSYEDCYWTAEEVKKEVTKLALQLKGSN